MKLTGLALLGLVLAGCGEGSSAHLYKCQQQTSANPTVITDCDGSNPRPAYPLHYAKPPTKTPVHKAKR